MVIARLIGMHICGIGWSMYFTPDRLGTCLTTWLICLGLSDSLLHRSLNRANRPRFRCRGMTTSSPIKPRTTQAASVRWKSFTGLTRLFHTIEHLKRVAGGIATATSPQVASWNTVDWTGALFRGIGIAAQPRALRRTSKASESSSIDYQMIGALPCCLHMSSPMKL